MNKHARTAIRQGAQGGFTLIELIVVIVILGILAATALPRFADLGGDARAASMTAAIGAIKSGSAIAHGQALVNNTGNASTAVTLEGTAITMAFGYPTANAAGIFAAAGLSTNDYTLTVTSTGVATIAPAKNPPANCSFTYAEATSAGGAPTITTTNVTVANCK